MKGITIRESTTVKDILSMFDGISPDTQVSVKGTVSIAIQPSLSHPGPDLIITDKEIGGLVTDEAPLGIPFLDAGNEHPLLDGKIMYLNDDSDNLLVIENILKEGAHLEDGQEYVGYAVQLPRYAMGTGDEGYYTESAVLIFIEDTYGNRDLIGHIVDVDDADDTFIGNIEGWDPSGYGVVNTAVHEMEESGAIYAELFRTRDAAELLTAAAIYTAEVTDGVHLYANVNGAKQSGNFSVMAETVTVTDSYGDDVDVTIGIVLENDTVRVVYVNYDEEDEDQLEKAIDASTIITPKGDGTYACNVQGVLSSKLSQNVKFYDGGDAIVGLYNTEVLVGAAMAAIDMVEYDNLYEDEDDDD